MRSKAERKERERFRCSEEEGVRAGLVDSDLCSTRSKRGEKTYYLAPTCNFNEIQHELTQAQTHHNIKEFALEASTSSTKRQIFIPSRLSQDNAKASSSSTTMKPYNSTYIPKTASTTSRNRVASTSYKKRKILDGEIGAFIPSKLSQVTASASSASTVNKRSPTEREYHNRVNNVLDNPHEAILEFDKEFDKLKEELYLS